MTSIIKEKRSRYTPPTKQGWEEKEEGVLTRAAIQNTKKRVTQVSIIKEKRSRYTPPAKQGWQEKKEGNKDDGSYSKHKIKETQVSTILKKTFKVDTTD